MKHYSINATDIYIEEIISEQGWYRGKAHQYQVSNCNWSSLVEIQQIADKNGVYELRGKQTFTQGDKNKMLHDQGIMRIALNLFLFESNHNTSLINW